MIKLMKEEIIKIKKLYETSMKIDNSNKDCLSNLFEGEKLLVRNNYIGVLQDGYYHLYAATDFDDVHIGDEGGLLSEDSYLEDNGHAWIYPGVVVYNSNIYDNVKIKNGNGDAGTSISHCILKGNIIISDDKYFFNFETNNHSDKIIDGESVIVYEYTKSGSHYKDYSTVYFYKYLYSGDNVIEIVAVFGSNSYILEDHKNVINMSNLEKEGCNAIIIKDWIDHEKED